MEKTSGGTRHEVAIAVLIALSVAAALFLDARMESRIFESGPAARTVASRFESPSAVSGPASSPLVVQTTFQER